MKRAISLPGRRGVMRLSTAMMTRGWAKTQEMILLVRRALQTPTRAIIAQGRWKAAVMIEIYARGEEAEQASGWLF